MDSAETTPLRRARTLQPESNQRCDRTPRPRPASMREKIGARWCLTRLAAKTAEPPIVRPKIKLRDGDVEAFRNLAHSVVSRTLAHECEYRRQGSPEPAVQEWKLVKRHNGLRLFKSKAQQQEPQLPSSQAPTVFCLGTIDGSLEDVLYGLHAKTRREMHVVNAFQNKGRVKKCAVLSTIDHGTDSDPFRQLALKWVLAQTAGDARHDNYRDACTIESMGSRVDCRGERYGYRLIKSVDLAEYPQLSTSNAIVRAKMTMCCIFRQDADSRRVSVYSKGMTDMGEDAPSFPGSIETMCAMMLSIANAAEVAEAKRLTLLALQRAEYTACLSQQKYDESELEDSSRATESTITTITSPVEPAADFTRRECSSQKTSSDLCSVCGKKPPMSTFVRTSHRCCGVCQQRVCSKCQVKRRLFARSDTVAVSCCKICILAAKRLHVDPRDPYPMLSTPPTPPPV